VIYILKSNFEGQPNWMNDFSNHLEYGLNEAGAEVRAGVDILTLNDLGTDDYVFITHYEHLDTIEAQQTKAKVIFHHHGSGVSPYTHWINAGSEIWHLYNVVDINTFCMPTQEKLVVEKYPITQDMATTIGFPLNFNRYPYNRPKKKKIVVAGHIGPERQFYLATYLLKDLIPEYEVVFSILETPGSTEDITKEWSKFYALERFIDMGFKFVRHPDSESFYLELADASHIFTCSLGDTFSVSMVEGVLSECIPVAPYIKNFWPMYMDWLDVGYEPFSKTDVEHCIRRTEYRDNFNPKADLSWFNPKKVAERLLEVL
jgi:hypothetical protein